VGVQEIRRRLWQELVALVIWWSVTQMFVLSNTQARAELWLNKATSRQQVLDETMLAFEKFFSLFVAFNILYSHAAIKLEEPNPREDKKHATRTFALWVGHEVILSNLDANPVSVQDLATLRGLIQRTAQANAPFFLFWLPGTDGIPKSDVSKNSQLCQRLVSDQPVLRAEAILEYLYMVRCNIFHGTKALVRSQLEMLEPSIRCLEQIVELGMGKLRHETGNH
jgi:hypothetical protein